MALPHREVMNAWVGSNDVASRINELAHACARLGTDPLDDLDIAPLRYEADLLALRLVRHGEIDATREVADLFLLQLAERETDRLEIVRGALVSFAKTGSSGPL